MSSALGIADEKIRALDHYADSALFSDAEQAALVYADAITLSGKDVDDALYARVARHFGEEALVELTAVIAWENASSKFNRALRIGSQELWKRGGE